jgi:hypothetical protein
MVGHTIATMTIEFLLVYPTAGGGLAFVTPKLINKRTFKSLISLEGAYGGENP